MGKLLKPEEVADMLSLHPETVRLMARNGAIPALKVGNRWRFDEDALREWLADRTTADQARMGL